MTSSRWRQLIILAFAVVVLVAGGWFVKSRTAPGAPALPPPQRDNILLITLDTTRADRIGAYGYPRARTPRIDRLAAEGVRFTDAHSPSSVCAP